MQVLRGILEWKNSELRSGESRATAVTIGNFDGVHLGHKKLLSILKSEAEARGLQTVVYTFDPHPLVVLGPASKHVRLFSQEDQVTQLTKMGIDHLILEPFNRDFSELSAAEFLETYIDRLNPKVIVVGFDFGFGKSRQGGLQSLKDYCARKKISFHVVDAFELEGSKVSTSRVKAHLSRGEVEDAAKCLGRSYYLEGVVKKGFQRGRTIGVPTANIEPGVEFIPKVGVYKSRTYLQDSAGLESKAFESITNVGFSPTFSSERPVLKAETHIFDFDQQIYGDNIRVELLKFIREEKKFSGIEELKAQILKDFTVARQ